MNRNTLILDTKPHIRKTTPRERKLSQREWVACRGGNFKMPHGYGDTPLTAYLAARRLEELVRYYLNDLIRKPR